MDSVVLETSLGDVQLELYWDHAPRVRFSSFTQSYIVTNIIRHARILQNLRDEGITTEAYSIVLSLYVYIEYNLLVALTTFEIGFYDSRRRSNRNR